MRYFISLAAIIFFNINVLAQFVSFDDWNDSRIRHQNTAMTVLGTWAIINIGGGLILQSGSEGELKYFHQMNAGWNIINAGISGISLYRAIHKKSQTLDLNASMKQLSGFQNALLFNAGLDAGYVMAGFYLMEKSKQKMNPDRWRGYGKSIALQGAFLYCFDLLSYFTSLKFNKQIIPTFNSAANGGIEIGFLVGLD